MFHVKHKDVAILMKIAPIDSNFSAKPAGRKTIKTPMSLCLVPLRPGSSKILCPP
jgi:hypothetical protein